MKNIMKKIVYLVALGMLLMTFCGCDEDEKIDPEEFRKYAEMCDPETLREYAAMLEDVAASMEATELESGEAFEEAEEAIDEMIEEAAEEEKEKDAEAKDEETATAEEASVENDKTEEDTADKEETEDEVETEDESAKEADEKQDTEEADEKNTESEEVSEEIIEIALSSQYESENYNIPSIDDGSEAAEKINEEIYEFAKNSIELEEAILDGSAKDKDEVPEFTNIDYVVYQYGDIASIVVTGTDENDNHQYKVINYNTKTQKAVTEDDLLEYIDIDSDDLNKFISNTIGAYVLSDVDEYIGFIGAFYDESEPAIASVMGVLAEIYQVAISQTDLLDNVMIYINEEGTPCVAGSIMLPEDMGGYDFDIALDTSEEPEMFKKYKKYTEDYHYPEFEMDCFALSEGNGYTFEIAKENRTDDFDYESVSIGFNKDDNSEFIVSFKNGKEEYKYSGTVSLAGFSEDGIEFEYSLDKLNGDKLSKNNIKKGTFSLLVELDVDDDGNISYQNASIKSIDGYDFTGANGEAVVFNLIEEFK